jgi:hypothetical protein
MDAAPIFAPSSLAQWLSAVGTISAVVVALFKDAILALSRKPRLEVTCTKEEPFTSKTPIIVSGNKGPWTGEAYYVRARVENTGKTRAEKVQVYAANLAVAGADRTYTDVPGFIPLNVKWSNSPHGTVSPILDGISPKMAAFCDLVALTDPTNPYQARPQHATPNVTIAQLQLEVDPLSGSNLLAPGTYRLTLRIAAANATQPLSTRSLNSHTAEHGSRTTAECEGNAWGCH